MIRNVFQLKTAAVIYNNKEVGTSSSLQRLLKVAATASRKKLTVKLRPSRGLIQPRLFTIELVLQKGVIDFTQNLKTFNSHFRLLSRVIVL